MPTLVYACTVEHARVLATKLNILGRKSVFIDSNTNKAERRNIRINNYIFNKYFNF